MCIRDSYFHGTRAKGNVTSPFLFPKGVSGKEYFGDLGYHRDIADALHDPYQFDGFEVELPKDGQIVTDKNEAFRFEHGKMTQLEKNVLWEFSFSKYIERQGLTDLNAVTILMGANDLQICPYEESDKRIAKFMDNMGRFVQSVREYSAALPIVINLPVLDVYKRQLHKFLLSCHKFGNNLEDVDDEAAEIAERIADIVSSKKNYLGNPFRPDFSSPSTHLLYGYWVSATPDGRKAREMLGYGVDPVSYTHLKKDDIIYHNRQRV